MKQFCKVCNKKTKNYFINNRIYCNVCNNHIKTVKTITTGLDKMYEVRKVNYFWAGFVILILIVASTYGN